MAVRALVAGLLLSSCTKEVILQGTRFPVRAPLADSIPVDGQPAPVPPPDQPPNTSVPISLPAMVSNADWPQRAGNVHHAGLHGVLSATPQLVWSAPIGTGNSHKNRINAAPVVAGGLAFAMDAQSRVTAVSLQGSPVWSRDLTASFDAGGGLSGGGLAAEGGRVFATTGYGETIALNAADGSVIWRQRMGAMPSGAPSVAGNQVLVVTDDGTGWALDAATGRTLWTATGASTPDSFRSDAGSAPAVDGQTVVLPFSSGILMGADLRSGASKWTAAVSGTRLGSAYADSGDITGDPVIVGGVLYAGTQGGRTGAFSAATGQRIWTAEEGALNPPLVVGGSVFTVNDNGRLVRMSAQSGETIWAVDLPYFRDQKPKKHRSIAANYGPVLAGGHLIVVSSDGYLRSFNPTDGSLVGQVAIPGGAATPAALAQGLLLVVNSKGQLLAFR
ncbi:PQQ-binding-like beta-propeller repeat protein [bacterium]|nr:PQQ-binding-like beta-propeller repeat protein [bacterium]